MPYKDKEKQKEHYKEYNQRQEVKKRKKEWIKKNRKKLNKKHKEYMKEYSKENKDKIREWQKRYEQTERGREAHKISQNKHGKKYPKRIKARSLAEKIFKILEGQLCEVCKINKAIEKHHPDYSKPLKVIFLCIKCHKKIHKENRK